MGATVYRNGRILTMDEDDSIVAAVAVASGRIAAAGTEEEAARAAGPDAESVDLGGKTMIPAFIDPHGHFPETGFIGRFREDLSSPARGSCMTLRDVLDRLADRARRTPAGEWVMGVLFDFTAIPEGRYPTREELDAVSSDHPVWIINVSGHGGSANSRALEAQGLTERTPDPVGGRYVRDPKTGRLSGAIEGMAAMGELGDTLFLIDEQRFLEGFEAARTEYLEQGVTLAQNSWADMTVLGMFARIAAMEDPGIDLMVLPAGELEPGLMDGESGLEWPHGDHVRTGPRKLFSDGAFQNQTAYLTKPYHKPKEPGDRGQPYTTVADLDGKVDLLHRLGCQIHIHANGDAAADMFLDSVEKALNKSPRDDHRHTIIHGQTLRDDQLERMAGLGVSVSFFSAHVHFWGDRHRSDFLGPERAGRISPAGSAVRKGVRFTIHNDAAVTPTRPLHLMACAVDRLTASGMKLGADQAITPLQALRAHTIDAAWQVFLEEERGSIEPGKVADFAVLSRDPLAAGSLSDIKVERTIRRGKTVA